MCLGGSRHRVFVYGSLLRGLHNHHRLGTTSTLLLAAAQTADPFVLVDSGQGYPYALEAACARPIDTAAPLVGEVYEVTDQVLYESLDPLEDHPDIYRRRVVELANGAGQASLYILHDKKEVAAICSDVHGSLYAPTSPPGDWRSHLKSVRAVPPWPASRRTLTEPGPHAVFSYGCNGLQTLRERCRNPAIRAVPAELRGATRIFGGHSQRWNGAVSSIIQQPGGVIYGNVAFLSREELLLLDEFESAHPSEPYSLLGVYRRQDVTVHVGRRQGSEGDGGQASAGGGGPGSGGEGAQGSGSVGSEASGARSAPLPAIVYIRTDTAWVGPPSPEYLEACARNIKGFWDEERAVIEVLNEKGLPL